MEGLLGLFLNPWALLAGGLAVSVPVIIHLINRMQFRRVRWAAMEFLLAAQKKMRRRMILEQLILLLLRIALMLLAGLLLSRWLVSGEPPAPPVDLLAHDVLLDDSMSMSDREPSQGEERESIQAARDEVVRLAGELAKGRIPANLRVRLASDPDNPVFDEQVGEGSAQALASALSKVSAKPARIAMAAPLKAVIDASLALADKGRIRRTVHLHSDLRANDWADGQMAAECQRFASQNGEIRLLDCASPSRTGTPEPQAHGNLALLGLVPETRSVLEGQPVTVTAMVANLGRDPRRSGLSVLVNGARDSGASALIDSLPPGKVTSVPFRVVPSRPAGAPQVPGTPNPDPARRDAIRRADPVLMSVRVTVEDSGRTGLAADDTRDLVLPVRSRFPLLVIDGSSSGRTDGSLGSDALHLGAALNPQLFDAEFRDPRELPATDIGAYPMIAMLNVTDLPDTEVARLDAFVREGGGLAWFTGDRTDPAFANRLYSMAGLFPLPLASQPSPAWSDQQREDYRKDDSPKIVLPDPENPVVAGLASFRQVFRFLRIERHWPPATDGSWRQGAERVLALPARSWSNAVRRDDLRQRILKAIDLQADPYTRPEAGKALAELARRAANLRGRLAAGSQFEVVAALESFLDLGQPAASNPLRQAWETPALATRATELTDLVREIQEGDPLLVSRNRGAGRVTAFLTSAGPQLSKPPAPGEPNIGWNEWANGFLSATYPILIQDSLIDLLRAGGQGIEARPLLPVKIPLPRDRIDPEVVATFLAQTGPTKGVPPKPESVVARVVQEADESLPAELVLPARSLPGYYSATLYPKGRRMAEGALVEHKGIAVNVDTTESDLRRAPSAMITGGEEQQGKGIRLASPGERFDSASDLAGRKPIDASETPWIFLAILLVLVGEQAMALRVSHLRKPDATPAGGGRR